MKARLATRHPSSYLMLSCLYDNSASGAYGKGRLWKTQTAGAMGSLNTIDAYDALGRPLTQRQQFKVGSNWSQSYSVSRSYDRAGQVLTQTYPSGHAVNYAYDFAGRTSSFSGNLGAGASSRTYSTGIIYDASARMIKERFGTDTPIYNKLKYNGRGQLTEILESTSDTGASDATWNRGKIVNDYECSGSGCNDPENNGNLRKQTLSVPYNEENTSATSWYQQYDYDSLNRLQRVHEYTGNTSLDWQQEFVYDRFGNRTIHQSNTFGAGIPKPNFTVNPANNRLGVPSGQTGTMTYDSAGNLTTDTYSAGAATRVYDAENRMTADMSGDDTNEYTYDGDGRRVKRYVATEDTETWQIYGLGGELL